MYLPLELEYIIAHFCRSVKRSTRSSLTVAVCGGEIFALHIVKYAPVLLPYLLFLYLDRLFLCPLFLQTLYIRVGPCYTAGSSFTSSPQGSRQVERKTYITLPVVSPSLNPSSMLVCVCVCVYCSVLSAVSIDLPGSIDVPRRK